MKQKGPEIHTLHEEDDPLCNLAVFTNNLKIHVVSAQRVLPSKNL